MPLWARGVWEVGVRVGEEGKRVARLVWDFAKFRAKRLDIASADVAGGEGEGMAKPIAGGSWGTRITV